MTVREIGDGARASDRCLPLSAGQRDQSRLPADREATASRPTTDANPGANPSHATPNRHRHIDKPRDRRNIRKQSRSPSPNRRTLVGRQGIKLVLRSRVPKTSVDALGVLLFTTSAFPRLPSGCEAGTTEQPRERGRRTPSLYFRGSGGLARGAAKACPKSCDLGW